MLNVPDACWARPLLHKVLGKHLHLSTKCRQHPLNCHYMQYLLQHFTLQEKQQKMHSNEYENKINFFFYKIEFKNKIMQKQSLKNYEGFINLFYNGVGR